VGLGDAEVGEQEGDRLGGHGRAAVGMEGQLPGWDRLLGDGFGDQAVGQGGLLAVGDHPANHVAAVDIEDDVQVEVGPLGRSEQFGDVPAPDLIRRRGEQLRLGVGGVDELVTAWLGLPLGSQEPIHRAFGGEVDLLIQEGGVDGRRRGILEARRVQHLQHGGLFGCAQGAWVDARDHRLRTGRCW
jgi:hypothetical protein